MLVVAFLGGGGWEEGGSGRRNRSTRSRRKWKSSSRNEHTKNIPVQRRRRRRPRYVLSLTRSLVLCGWVVDFPPSVRLPIPPPPTHPFSFFVRRHLLRKYFSANGGGSVRSVTARWRSFVGGRDPKLKIFREGE